MENDWILGLWGGGLIGISVSLLLLINGRIAGISGIFFGLIEPSKGGLWKIIFLLGLVLGGVAMDLFNPVLFFNATPRPLWVTALAGLLVGIGTRVGSGCTSGHGVCGVSRLSVRSLVAMLCFVGSGMVTAVVYSLLWGAK